MGHRNTPPGVHFRMLLIGYFEGIDSERRIAWRCAHSRTLSELLGYGLMETTPDLRACLSMICRGIGVETHRPYDPRQRRSVLFNGLLENAAVSDGFSCLDTSSTASQRR